MRQWEGMWDLLLPLLRSWHSEWKDRPSDNSLSLRLQHHGVHTHGVAQPCALRLEASNRATGKVRQLEALGLSTNSKRAIRTPSQRTSGWERSSKVQTLTWCLILNGWHKWQPKRLSQKTHINAVHYISGNGALTDIFEKSSPDGSDFNPG